MLEHFARLLRILPGCSESGARPGNRAPNPGLDTSTPTLIPHPHVMGSSSGFLSRVAQSFSFTENGQTCFYHIMRLQGREGKSAHFRAPRRKVHPCTLTKDIYSRLQLITLDPSLGVRSCLIALWIAVALTSLGNFSLRPYLPPTPSGTDFPAPI